MYAYYKKFKHSLHVCCGEVDGGGGGGGGGEHRGNFDWKVPTEGQPSQPSTAQPSPAQPSTTDHLQLYVVCVHPGQLNSQRML